MPIQAPQWTEFLSCPICCHEFDGDQRGPISLGCGHTVCRLCLAKLQRNQCPYDQTVMRLELDQLPVNGALLSLVTHNSIGSDNVVESGKHPPAVPSIHAPHYMASTNCIKQLALLLKPYSGSGLNGATTSSILSRPMLRKLVTLINCQLVEEEGRARAVRAARSLGERTVTELILHHQNHHQLSANLWAAVRSRGCQFLGPAMQEEVLKLVLLALEDSSALSRKVLVMFVVQRLEPHFPQASKTSIGHVVQLLYRASCFKVSKREGDSSLMQLKEEFRTYDALRREHDAQIVQIATEAGLRIAPDQWSSLLYGDTAHKSHMQSIIDKLQTPQSFGQSVQELVIALQRTGDPGQLSSLRPQLELLADLDPSPDSDIPGWERCCSSMEAIKAVVIGLVHFIQHHGNRKITDAHHAHNAKYKTSMCRDLAQRGGCPRGNDCTFAHSEDELEKFRSRNRKQTSKSNSCSSTTGSVPNNNGQVSSTTNHHSLRTVDTKPPPSHPSGNHAPYLDHQMKNQQHHQMVLESNRQGSPCGILQKPMGLHHPTANGNNHNRSSPPEIHTNLQQNSTKTISTPSQYNNSMQQHSQDQGRNVVKNGGGERSAATRGSMIGKHIFVEEMIPMQNQNFEGPKFVPTAHPMSVLQGPPPPSVNVLRPPAHLGGQPTGPSPVYATPMPPDYAAAYHHGSFHPHPPGAPIFAPNPNIPPPGTIHSLHAPPPQGGGPATQVFTPPSVLQEMFNPTPQTLLVNQGGQVYNILGPPRDMNTPIADTRPTASLGAKSSMTSWPELSQEQFLRSEEIAVQQQFANEDLAAAEELLATKSLHELKERKDEILSQLENIVGKEAIDEVATQIENGDPVTTASISLSPEFSSTYSIWTSGANLTNISWSKKNKDKMTDAPEVHEAKNRGEEFVPFDPPIHSRFGPISRMSRPFIRQSAAIQVSACSTTDPVTTPTVNRPVPAISPMPQIVYQHPGFPLGLVTTYPPTLEYMNTIGHGIIDPPHLHMSQLEPSGGRPTDPIVDYLNLGHEEQQRQHLLAAKEGIEPSPVGLLSQRFEEMRLKEELNLVLQGIHERKKAIELNNNTKEEEDMKDFEKNWNFDFGEEADKDD